MTKPRFYSLTVPCPRCEVSQGQQCISLTTRKAKAVHQERIDYARALVYEENGEQEAGPGWVTNKTQNDVYRERLSLYLALLRENGMHSVRTHPVEAEAIGKERN